MKKQVNKECKYIIMSFTTFVTLPGWCTNHMESTCPVHTFRKYIHYHYGAYMIWCRCIIIKVHVNNHAYTKNNHF